MKAIEFKINEKADFSGTLYVREDIGDWTRRPILGYSVKTPTNVILIGDGFVPSLGTAWDSPESVYQLLFFMTQTPDSGASFEDWTPDELAWSASEECESWSYVFSDDSATIRFWYEQDEWDVYVLEDENTIWIKELDNVG